MPWLVLRAQSANICATIALSHTQSDGKVEHDEVMVISGQSVKHRLALYTQRGWETCTDFKLSADVVDHEDLSLEPLFAQVATENHACCSSRAATISTCPVTCYMQFPLASTVYTAPVHLRRVYASAWRESLRSLKGNLPSRGSACHAFFRSRGIWQSNAPAPHSTSDPRRSASSARSTGHVSVAACTIDGRFFPRS